MVSDNKRLRIGDVLVQSGIITNDELLQALDYSKENNVKIGKAVVSLNFATESDICEALGQQLGMPVFSDLSKLTIDSATVSMLPENLARQKRALAISQSFNENTGNNVVTVVIADPLDYPGRDEIQDKLEPNEVDFVIAPEMEIVHYLSQLYKNNDTIAKYANQLQTEVSQSAFELNSMEQLSVTDGLSDVAVVNLLRSVFEDAVSSKASDIHIEPDVDLLRIRQRIDGNLAEQTLNNVDIAPAIALRLKLMAGLDISEKRLPQDGRFPISIGGKNFDVRLSTLPTQYGESIVMRLLNQSDGLLSLDSTGMPPELLVRFRAQLHRPHGMILVTGPTGSGKTTTLYGALNELNNPNVKIITVEDPVEYRLPRIQQVQVQTKVGLDFAKVLRSCLRQDPDVILVGEMRDLETAEIGLRGAMTGHLVLSTLHTNDAVSSALRFMDMGAAGYSVAGSLKAVLAQRLVRKVCPKCVKAYTPTQLEMNFIEDALGIPVETQKQHEFKMGNNGRGCQFCNFSGYKGRVGVFEFLELSQKMMDALRREDHEAFSREALADEGYKPLSHMAYHYATKGITTLEEVIKVSEVIK
ncbi:MAG: GspE/PulE family protein [Ruminobacter sp.]|nr:GspE/PulE family protein [Ruminobacter sp.]